jgi:hypothetical protein
MAVPREKPPGRAGSGCGQRPAWRRGGLPAARRSLAATEPSWYPADNAVGPEAISLLRVIKRMLLWAGAVLAAIALMYGAVIAWPDPFFAFSVGTGEIVVASDRPIPSAGGQRFVQDCERRLARSLLKPRDHQYHVYVTNEDWRQRLFFLPHPDAWAISYTIGLWGTSLLEWRQC